MDPTRQEPQHELNLTAFRIDSAAKTAHTKLMAALHQTEVSSKYYALKSRVKTPDQLLKKRTRKIQKKPEYELTTITDVLGIRFVTLFQSEMPEVFEILLRLISHSHELNPNPFKTGCLEEAKIYYTDPHSPILKQLKPIFEQFSFSSSIDLESELTEAKYSSIHLVARLCETVDGMDNYNIPVEIQIRTVFEDAWGEIDHKFGYIQREGKGAGQPTSNADHVMRHLKALKKFADACSDYAEAISREATEQYNGWDSTGKVLSVRGDDELLERFIELGVPPALVLEYRDARGRRERGQELITSDPEKALLELLRSAEVFRSLADTVRMEGNDAGQEKARVFYYYSRMNEAVCLLSTKRLEHVQSACAIYESLTDEFGEYVILRMRLGQAYGRLGRGADALRELRWVADRIWSTSAGVTSTDELPEVDFKHMDENLPTLLGYQLWSAARKLPPSSESLVEQKISLLREASSVTSRLLDKADVSPELQKKTWNNLIYYAMDMLCLREHLGPGEVADLESRMNSLTSSFANSIRHLECDDIEYLDTLSKAYDKLGDGNRAGEIAERIIRLIITDTHNGEADPGEIDLMLREAWDLATRLGVQLGGSVRA